MKNKEPSFKRPRLKTRFVYRVRRLLRCWPLLVWLALAAWTWYLYAEAEQFGGMIGTVSTLAEPVAPLRTARLLSVEVRPGQRVKAGDVLAHMDTSSLEAELAIAEARMVEAESTISGYQQNILTLVRQFDTAIKDAESAMATQKRNQERDSAELAELKKEQKRREELLAKRFMSEQEANALRPQVAALERSVSAYPSLLDSLERQLEETKKQKEEMKKWLRIEGDADMSDAIRAKMKARSHIFKSSKQMLELQRSTYTLRATRDGVVSRILHEAGDVVSAGDPVLRLVADHSDEIVGFLPEIHVSGLSVGQKAHVWRQNGKGGRIEAIVESVGPEVQTLPARISPIQGQMLRGRRAMIRLLGTHDLVPGETVQVRITHGDSSGIGGMVAAFFKETRGHSDSRKN